MDAAALPDHLVAELGDTVEPEISHGLLTVTVRPEDWRHVAEAPLGPLAAGRPGVAVLIGRALAWFPSRDPS